LPLNYCGRFIVLLSVVNNIGKINKQELIKLLERGFPMTKDKILNSLCCKLCNKPFAPKRPHQIFCTKECSLAFYKDKYNKIIRPQQLRFKILIRDNFTCQYCGRTPQQHNIALHVDHINPRCNGGKDEEDNFITACEDCNFGKGGKYFGELCTTIAKRP
jgi:hypothetical protein